MSRTSWQSLINELREAERRFIAVAPPSMGHLIEFDPGLTNAEVRETESRFGFRFPPDLREFLQTALPRGPRFPDWRSGNEEEIREWLDEPRRGILFDIEHNGFWLPEWGPVPGSLAEAFRIASELVAAAPRLIPICGHRMMPDEPHLPGNPVFSVHQTDIIVYGPDLETYLRLDFHLESRGMESQSPVPIRFWDIGRFQEVRWEDGSCVFDNSKGVLP